MCRYPDLITHSNRIHTQTVTPVGPTSGVVPVERGTGVAVIFFHRELFSTSREFYRLYYPLCVSRRIDTWQIVYLSYKDPCPKI